MLKQLETTLFQLRTNLLITFLMLIAVSAVSAQGRRTPKPPGVPNEIQITPYKTTMIADGKDEALIKIKIIDSKNGNYSGMNLG